MNPCPASSATWIPTLLSLAAICVSIKAWSKSRTVYGVETIVLRQPTGGRDDLSSDTLEINKKLSAGHYTILSILQRRDGDTDLLLGRTVK